MKIVVAACCFVLSTALPGLATAQTIGVKGGVTFTRIATSPAEDFGIKSTGEAGLLGGGYVVLRGNARFSVQVDGLFAQKRIGFTVSDYTVTAFDVPVSVRWQVMTSGSGKVRAIGGVAASFLLQAKEKTVGNDPFDIKAAFETTTMGAFVGGQFDWKDRWLFDGRYHFGLSEVYTEPLPGFDSRYRGFDITVGYRFR